MMRDKFGKECSCLRRKRLFLFDMDGTIYMGNRLFEGTIELMKAIRLIGGKYVFITNNSSNSVCEYIEKLSSFGIEVDKNNFFTSSQLTIKYLKEQHSNKKIYCMGTASLVIELKNNGINVTSKFEEDADIVVIGFDTELTFKKIRDTCMMLQRDVVYIATNQDMVCPVEFGFVPDCGAMCEMIFHATGKRPIFIGKPNPKMVNYVMKENSFTVDETVVIGDRLYTDIATGINANVTTICVLTGEATSDDVIAGEIKPTFVFDSVKDLYHIIDQF